MCIFVRNKGNDDLRVTQKNRKKRIYMMPVNNNMAPSPQPVIANDSIKQKEEMTQDCSITLLLSPTKTTVMTTTVFQRAATLLGLILHRVQEQKNYPVKSTDHTLIIHGTHGEHGKRFQLKIILKILIHKQKRAESPMVSLAQGNTLRKSAFLLRIFFEDYSEKDYFLRQQFLKKISSKIYLWFVLS